MNIFPVTYEPVGELLASRSVRVCIINVAVYFWLVLRVNVTGCAGLAASCEWLRAVNVSLGLGGTERCGDCVGSCLCVIVYRAGCVTAWVGLRLCGAVTA